MNSIYTTSLKTQPIQNTSTTDLRDSSIANPISQSYKDLLFNHLLGIQHQQQTNKENLFQDNKMTKKRKNKYSSIAQTMILTQIPPQLGSLNQFISSPDSNRVIYTSKKKRNQQATEENILKKKILDKNSQENILKSLESSNYQKKIASKVLVERIFNQVYSTPVQQFVAKNTVKKTKQDLLNMSTLNSLLSINRNSIISRKTSFPELKQTEDVMNVLQQKKTGRQRIVRTKFDHETKLKKINELKSNYYNLKRLQIPQQNPDFTLLIDAQNKLENYLRELTDHVSFSQRSSAILNAARNSLLDANVISGPKMINVQESMLQVSQKFRSSRQKSVVFAQTIAKVTDDEVWFKRIQLKDLEMGLYMIGYIRLQRIQVIRMENLSINQSILFLFLDVLCKFAPQIKPLKEVSICSIAIQDVMKFSEKVSQLLREINVKRLCLNCIDIGSKEFTKMCVGMAENQCLEEVEMKYNRIDLMAVKSLETMLKINRNIKSIDLRGNDISNYFNAKEKDSRIILDEAE